MALARTVESHNAPEAQFFEVSAACPLCGEAGASYRSPIGCSCSCSKPGRMPPAKVSPGRSPPHDPLRLPAPAMAWRNDTSPRPCEGDKDPLARSLVVAGTADSGAGGLARAPHEACAGPAGPAAGAGGEGLGVLPVETVSIAADMREAQDSRDPRDLRCSLDTGSHSHSRGRLPVRQPCAAEGSPPPNAASIDVAQSLGFDEADADDHALASSPQRLEEGAVTMLSERLLPAARCQSHPQATRKGRPSFAEDADGDRHRGRRSLPADARRRRSIKAAMTQPILASRRTARLTAMGTSIHADVVRASSHHSRASRASLTSHSSTQESPCLPGFYDLHREGTVTAGPSIFSDDVTTLGEGARVRVLEIATLQHEDRIRGRLAPQQPDCAEGGWISLRKLSSGECWATPFEAEALSRASRASASSELEAIRNSIAPSVDDDDEDSTTGDTALGVLESIFWTPISLLLVAAPLGMASAFLGWGDFATFWLNFLAMIPLAKILGDATEELAACLKNDTLSGLLNATFGNAVEMIMTVCLLRQGQYFVVKTTLVGSMLSNMLLVLGTSFFLGGLWGRRSPGSDSSDEDEEGGHIGREQTFNILGAMTNTSMLILSALVLVLCTVFESVGQGGVLWASPDDPAAHRADIAQFEREEIRRDTLPVSHDCAILILIMYLAYVVFQLVTHGENMADSDDEDEEAGGSALGLRGALLLMAGATLIVSFCSELLTNALQGALADSRLSKGFVGVVLMPVIGNACEHSSAIRFAFQDKMGLSMSIAVGSSVQIALCVAPFAVVVGWIIGNSPDGTNMTLNFGLLNVAVITMSVILILAVVIDGKSNWLEGFMLTVAYVVIAVLYWYLPDPAEEGAAGPPEHPRVSAATVLWSLWHA